MLFVVLLFIPSLQIGGLKFAGQSDALYCRGAIPFFKLLFQFVFLHLPDVLPEGFRDKCVMSRRI